MNKKLLSVVLSATCVIALAACGGSNDATILADADHATYCIAGPEQTKVGGESIAWDYSEAGVMTASSRNDLKEVSLDLYNDLKAVKLSSLYILEDVVIGAEAAGYNKTALLDGDLVQADGALTLKTASINYDAVDDVYSIDEWLVSPEHYGETLTPDTYWCSPHYETPDENGFAHDSDPVVVSGAGSYTVVLARYVDTKEDGSTLGIGLVLQEANPEGQQVTPIVPVDVTSLGAIGSFAASEGWAVEAALTKNEEDVWEGDVEAVAGNEFKIRANGAWTYSWGFAAVTVAAAGIITDVGGNIGAVADGTYHISIVAPAQLSLISQDLTSFEITFEAAAVDPEALVTSIQADTNYKFGLDHQNLATPDIYYATGALDGFYAATTNVPADGADFMLVAVTGGYSVKVTLADDSVLYMNLVVSGDHTNIIFEVAASSVWTIDTTNNTIVTAVTGHTTATKDGTFFIGTSSTNTYTAFSCVLIDYVSTNYVARFYNVTVA